MMLECFCPDLIFLLVSSSSGYLDSLIASILYRAMPVVAARLHSNGIFQFTLF